MSKEMNDKVKEMGFSMTTVFVPFSHSRNSAEKTPSLNWKVTILYKDREVVTTDYMAGCGHCPSYKSGEKGYDLQRLLKNECETGFESKYLYSMGAITENKKKPILPDIADVMYSLVMDSEATEYEFEDWAANFGYEEDSRSAEKIYNECLQIGLKMLRTIGSDALADLELLFQDY